MQNYFHAVIIYFLAVIIYFHAVKIVLYAVRNLFPSGYFNDPYLVNVPLTANKSIIKTRKR